MKKPTYKGKELLPLSVIDAARDGDSQAVDLLSSERKTIPLFTTMWTKTEKPNRNGKPGIPTRRP